MKKFFYLIAIISILNLNLFAGMPVSQDALPQNIKDFITENFQGTIMYAEKDYDDYEVKLSDGVEIDFYLNGEWKEVKGKFAPIPTKFIPDNVMATIKNNYPQANVVEIEKKYFNNYKIKLDNWMELYIDYNGNLLGQKFDD